MSGILFTVDTASGMTLADQIATQVRHGVDRGALTPGTRLPPARELAAALEVNMHTVLRAYQDLRDEGIVELRQGRGATIRSDLVPARVRIDALAAQLKAEAARLGMPTHELLRIVEAT